MSLAAGASYLWRGLATPLSLEHAFDFVACFGAADFSPEDPMTRFRAMALLGSGSYNEVYALEGMEGWVLRINARAPSLLEDAEKSGREAYLMTALGRAGVSPRVESFGWTPDGRAWSVQERAEGSLAQWLEGIVALPPGGPQLFHMLATWRHVTAPSLLRVLRLFASLDFYQDDINPSNVVLRQGSTAQLIDFDQAVPSGEGSSADRCERALGRAVATLTSYIAGYAALGPAPHDALVAALLDPFAEELAAAAALSTGRLHRQILALIARLPRQPPPEASVTARTMTCVGWDPRQLEALLLWTRGTFLESTPTSWDPSLWTWYLHDGVEIRRGIRGPELM